MGRDFFMGAEHAIGVIKVLDLGRGNHDDDNNSISSFIFRPQPMPEGSSGM